MRCFKEVYKFDLLSYLFKSTFDLSFDGIQSEKFHWIWGGGGKSAIKICVDSAIIVEFSSIAWMKTESSKILRFTTFTCCLQFLFRFVPACILPKQVHLLMSFFVHVINFSYFFHKFKCCMQFLLNSSS